MLKVKGHYILNLRDLQNHCALWEILRQKNAFLSFAKVHCVRLPVVFVTQENKGRKAEWLKKEFWYALLAEPNLFEGIFFDGEGLRNGTGEYMECMAKLCVRYHERVRKARKLKEEFMIDRVDWEKPWEGYIDLCIEQEKESAGGELSAEDAQDIRKMLDLWIPEKAAREIRDEISLANIEEQVIWIMENSVSLEDIPPRTLTELLAILMLLETKPQSAMFEQNTATAPVRLSDGRESAPQYLKTPKEDKTVQLTARSMPYRYYLFEENALPPQALIETICIEAKRSKNEFEKVEIELYSEEKKETVRTFTLYPGEYRYCNAVQGKIAKFLPTMSIGDACCVYRQDYKSDTLMLREKEKDDVDWIHGRGISSFSIGQDGGLLIRDGRLEANRYRPYWYNTYVTDQLDEIIDIEDTIVEVCVTRQGYLLLDESGRICSNMEEYDGRKDIVSLPDLSWKKGLVGLLGVREFCVDDTKECIAVRMAQKSGCRTYWKGEAEINENGDCLEFAAGSALEQENG